MLGEGEAGCDDARREVACGLGRGRDAAVSIFDEAGLDRAVLLGEELGGGDVGEVAEGVIERCLGSRSPEEDERGDNHAESAGDGAQSRSGVGVGHCHCECFDRYGSRSVFRRWATTWLREGQQLMNRRGVRANWLWISWLY